MCENWFRLLTIISVGVVQRRRGQDWSAASSNQPRSLRLPRLQRLAGRLGWSQVWWPDSADQRPGCSRHGNGRGPQVAQKMWPEWHQSCCQRQVKKIINHILADFLIHTMHTFRPFERTVVLHKDSTDHVGFNFNKGKITGLVKDSSAARNGYQIYFRLLFQ